MEYIKSLDDCLEHSEGRKYLESFMTQHFTIELFLFLKKYELFLNCETPNSRNKKGQEIMKDFISQSAPMQINISHRVRECINRSLKLNLGCFERDIFQEAKNEVYELIRNNVW